MSDGRPFEITAPAIGKARSLKVESRVHGTVKHRLPADRSPRLLEAVEMRWNSAKYEGAMPCGTR